MGAWTDVSARAEAEKRELADLSGSQASGHTVQFNSFTQTALDVNVNLAKLCKRWSDMKELWMTKMQSRERKSPLSYRIFL